MHMEYGFLSISLILCDVGLSDLRNHTQFLEWSGTVVSIRVLVPCKLWLRQELPSLGGWVRLMS